MKKSTSRRLFLQKSAIATTGLALMSSTVANAFTDDSPFEGYNPYSDVKTDLRTTIFEKHVRVKGTVYDKTGTTPLPNALVEVWHLSPDSKKFRHRAKLRTDDQGRYNFITDFPSKDETKATKIYFKVSNQEKTQFTELFIDRQGANISSKHWQENQQLKDKLLPSTESNFSALVVNFNVAL